MIARELLDRGLARRLAVLCPAHLCDQWERARGRVAAAHWCLLAPTAEFEQAMKRFRIDAAYWPFTIENAFTEALRRQAIAEGAYGVEEGRVQAAFLEEPSTAGKALDAVRDLDRTGDDAVLYFRPPTPDTKLAFAKWVA
jgi:hypothetical protein